MVTGTVLVVDDEEAIRETLRLALEGEGYRVVEAREGAEALRRAAQAQLDVILLDMRMPGMDGWAFVHEYRRRAGRGAPIVCMTAAWDADWRAWDVAADGVLPKPFELDELLQVVAWCCRPPA